MQETVSNQVMLVFAATAILLWGVSLISKYLDRGNTYGVTLTVTRVLAVVSALAAFGFALWYLQRKKNGRIRPEKAMHPGIIALFFAALSVCCGIFLYNPITGMRLIYVFLPALAILFLVFKVYDRQFFMFCVTHGIVTYALYRCYILPLGGHFRLLGVLIAAALCIFVSVLVFVPQKGRNALRIVLLGHDVKKTYLLPLYLITLGLLAAGFFLGGKIALALALMTGAYMIGATIYFTVKLI